MLAYPVELTPAEEGGFVVTFPDVPEAITQGDTLEEAITQSVPALEAALSFYTEAGRPLPVPSAAQGRRLVQPGAEEREWLEAYGDALASGPQHPPVKAALAVDPDLLGALRARGNGWQRIVNQALHDWLRTHPAA
jgi:predicted RNase H-like HicB family nuclease